MKLVVSIVGARPQFIKCAPVSRVLRKNFREVLIHTGQHYDTQMSHIFFEEMKIPAPDYNLGVGSGSHALQIGLMLQLIEQKLIELKPDLVLVYGDTNSTLAGALAAVQLQIPIAHVEAGLRSFNRRMPEEINRVLTDHISDLLFCPTSTAVSNLECEGVKRGVYFTGDVMFDALMQNLPVAEKHSPILNNLNLEPEDYLLTTIHRAENTDNKENLIAIFSALTQLDKKVVIPLHPRTKKKLGSMSLREFKRKSIKIIEPVSYLDMLVLAKNAQKILTDSGGVQKEAYFLKKPCITLRNETEWVELVRIGVNKLVGANVEEIIKAVRNFSPHFPPLNEYGNGTASERIVKTVLEFLDG
jgi:UDP-N-acetylglucosamine 2-epimerase